VIDHPKPLLVTGAHRSGTTWVGKMLAAGGDFAYVSEPLNMHHRPGVFNAPINHWYTYISSANEQDFLPAFGDTLALRYRLGAELKSLRSLKDAGRMGRDLGRFLAGRAGRRRPLLKDPFAVFSADWFEKRLGCRVIISVRHPAAFVSSLKRLGWSFNFNSLLDQPLLMADLLGGFEKEMLAAKNAPDDLIARGSLLWRMVYHVVLRYQQESKPFIVVRHEDLSLDPVSQFKSLYAQVGIDFTRQAQQRIRKATGGDNPAEVSRNSVHSVHLDSQANLLNWQKRLTHDEINQIRELTAEVAEHYYSAEDWPK